MAKKRSWFNLLKRFFLLDANSRSEKKDKRKRWIFGRFKKKPLPSISAPSPSDKTGLNQEQEENKKNAETADSNDQVVLISSCSHQSSTHCTKESQDVVQSGFYVPVVVSYQSEILEIQHLFATKIQSAFRGYLARKALRALKGVVQLQAIIRGWAVRRQAMNALKRLQTIVNIQSEFRAKRCEMLNHHHHHQFEESIAKDIKIDSNSQNRLDETLLSSNQKRWDDSLLSKEVANAVSMSKRVAAIKRERVREYWLNHRRSAESEQKLNVRQRYWLEQWIDKQLTKREELRNLETEFISSKKDKEELVGRRLKPKSLQKYYQIEGLGDSPLMHLPRRSFHQRKHSNAEDSIPTYMAATESAKAKVRSLSSPRLRPNMDAYSEINSPYKHKLSPISSINSEMTCISQISRPIAFPQRSPSLKGLGGSVKAKQGLKDFKLTPDFIMPS